MAQTMHNPATGLNVTETFIGPNAASLHAAMDSRRAELEAQGHTFVNRRMIGRNAQCPCGSGLKFKKCCIGKAALVGS